MKMPLRKISPMIKIVNNSLINLPSPSNTSAWLNFGSLLGLCLGIQLMTSIFLVKRILVLSLPYEWMILGSNCKFDILMNVAFSYEVILKKCVWYVKFYLVAGEVLPTIKICYQPYKSLCFISTSFHTPSVFSAKSYVIVLVIIDVFFQLKVNCRLRGPFYSAEVVQVGSGGFCKALLAPSNTNILTLHCKHLYSIQQNYSHLSGRKLRMTTTNNSR